MRVLTLATIASTLFACADARSPSGPQVSIAVAPLALPGVDEACYDVEVRNDLEALVWSRGSRTATHDGGDTTTICSGRFGNGPDGDIAYVGPCDASEADGADEGRAINTVTLWVDGLYRNGDDIGDWQDPCPGGCTLRRACVENEDRPVEFNLTILREANQGFFDVAVDFDDLFCSAKVDCQDALLHDGDTRAATAVIGFACTSGQGPNGQATPTTLYMNDVRVVCGDNESYTVTPIGAGNLGPKAPGLFETAVYHGDEPLEGYDKCYWNVALGLGDLGDDCEIQGKATAAQVPFGESLGAFWSPGATAWPYVEVKVPLTDALGRLECTVHPLNGGNGVTTRYTDLSRARGEAFDHRMTCGGEPVSATPIPPVVIAPSVTTLAVGATQTFTASGGVGPYVFSIATGSGTIEGAVFTATVAGPVTIRATDSRMKFAEAALTVFDPSPVVLSLSPTSGVTTGGTPVTISGSNFVGGPGASVTIGTSPCTGAVFTPIAITCVTPAGAVGARDVTVTNAGGVHATLANAFTYVAGEQWTLMTMTGQLPAPRSRGSSTWTGTHLVVMGGIPSSGAPYLADGARFDPLTNVWSSLGSMGYAPADMAPLVWTGSHLVVWGGAVDSAPYLTGVGSQWNGVSWSATGTINAPIPRRNHTAVWVANRMFVFGGFRADPFGATADGVLYDPASKQWSNVPTPPLSARYFHSAVTTGTQAIIWGGDSGSFGPLGDGAIYDGVNVRWRMMNATGAPSRRFQHSVAWTGTKMIVWGGYGPNNIRLNDGGIYDLATDAWTALPTLNAPQARAEAPAVWTGKYFIVWGGEDLDSGGRLDLSVAPPVWTPVTRTNAPSGRTAHTMIWTGTEMIVYGGNRTGTPETVSGQAQGWRYNPGP